MIAKIKQQAKGLGTELKRVDWPTKDKVLKSTYAVVVIAVFVGAFLWGADRVISWGMQLIFPHR